MNPSHPGTFVRNSFVVRPRGLRGAIPVRSAMPATKTCSTIPSLYTPELEARYGCELAPSPSVVEEGKDDGVAVGPFADIVAWSGRTRASVGAVRRGGHRFVRADRARLSELIRSTPWGEGVVDRVAAAVARRCPGFSRFRARESPPNASLS